MNKKFDQFIRCDGGTNIPAFRIVTVSVFPVIKPPSGKSPDYSGEFNVVARTDDGNYITIVNKVSKFFKAERISDEICRLLADGVMSVGATKRGAVTYIYCRRTPWDDATLTPVSRIRDAKYLPLGEGVLVQGSIIDEGT